MSLKQNLQQRFKGQESGPLATTWPSIPPEDRTAVLERLGQELGNSHLPPPAKRKKTDTAENSPQCSPDVRLGVNAVTRALEAHSKDGAAWPVGALVVANRGVRPPMLVQHLVVMAATRRVPVVALGVDSVALGEIVGLKRLLAIAVKDGGSLSEFLVRHAAVPPVPWAARREKTELRIGAKPASKVAAKVSKVASEVASKVKLRGKKKGRRS
jgi:ribosomal protein L7Ae-like RNA K-turn-binding protein